MRRGHARPRAPPQRSHRGAARRRQGDPEPQLPAARLHRLERRAQQIPVAAPQTRVVVRRHPADAARLVPVARPGDHDRRARRQARRRRPRRRRHHLRPHRQRVRRLVERHQLAAPAVRRILRQGRRTPPMRRRIGVDRQQRRTRIRRVMRRRHARPRAPRQRTHRSAARLRQGNPEPQLPAAGLHRLERRAQQIPVAAPQTRAVVRRHAADAARLVSVARPRDHDRRARRQARRRRPRRRRHHLRPHRQRVRRLVERHQLAAPAVRRILRQGRRTPPMRRRIGVDRQQRRTRIRRVMRRRHARPRAPRQRTHRSAARLRQGNPEPQLPAAGLHRLERRAQQIPVAAPQTRAVVRRHAADAARLVSVARPRDHDRRARRQARRRRPRRRRHHLRPHRQRVRRLVERHQLAAPAVRRTPRQGRRTPPPRRRVRLDRQQRRRVRRMARRRQTHPRAPRQRTHRSAARLRQRHPERQVPRIRIDRLERRPQREPRAAVRRLRCERGTLVARQRPDAARPIPEAGPSQEDRIAGPQAVACRRHGRGQEARLHRQRPRPFVERHELAVPAVRAVLRRRGGRRRGRRSRHPYEQTGRACGGAHAAGRPDPIFRLIQHGSLLTSSPLPHGGAALQHVTQAVCTRPATSRATGMVRGPCPRTGADADRRPAWE